MLNLHVGVQKYKVIFAGRCLYCIGLYYKDLRHARLLQNGYYSRTWKVQSIERGTISLCVQFFRGKFL